MVKPLISDNYWNSIAGMMVFMFILHISARGNLKTYIQFFFQKEPVKPTPNPTQAAQEQRPLQGMGRLFQPNPNVTTGPTGPFGVPGTTQSVPPGTGILGQGGIAMQQFLNGLFGVNPAM